MPNYRYKTTEAQAFAEVLTHSGADSEAIFAGVAMLKESKQYLEDFLLEMDGVERYQTGGGCTATMLPLEGGEVFVTTDEAGAIYANAEAYMAYENEYPLEHHWVYGN